MTDAAKERADGHGGSLSEFFHVHAATAYIILMDNAPPPVTQCDLGGVHAMYQVFVM